MARIRSIHPGIFTDEAWAGISIAARWLGQGIMTEADDYGVFEWKPLQIKMRIFPADNQDVPALLAELERAGIVQRFTVNGREYGAARNFCRYQRPRKPKSIYPMTDEIRTFVAWSGDGAEPEADEEETVPKKSEPVPQKSEKSPQMEDGIGEGDKEKENSRKPPRRLAYPPRFIAFWEGYPTDGGMSKSEAFTAWQKLGSEEHEAAIAALPAFRAYTSKQGPDYRMLHAVRYLRQRRWEGFTEQAAEDWKKRLDLARSRRQWPVKDWGPMPGQDGCRVPAGMIQAGDGNGWQEWRPAA